MGIIKGGALRLGQTLLYFVLFLCNGLILGIYAYYLATLADRERVIPNWERAVAGLSGAACLYLIFATLLTCCLAGIGFFSFLGLVFDVLFAACSVALAVLTRDGAHSCSGLVNTPLGFGPADAGNGFGNFGTGGADNNLTYQVKYGTACRLNSAAFAVSILSAILFLLAAGLQVAIMRRHKDEKRFGPGPSNGYTSGTGKRRFGFGRSQV